MTTVKDPVELWADFPVAWSRVGAPQLHDRRRIGTIATIRGARTIARRNPTAQRFILRGSIDALDRANGLSRTWTSDFDLHTHYVGISYEVIP